MDDNRKVKMKVSQYLASAFENSPIALVSLDTRLRIIMFNRAAEELTGFDSIDVVGCRINKLVSAGRIKNIIRIIRSRGRVSIDGYITKLAGRDGTEIPVKLRISPLFDSGKRLIGVLLMASDVREIKQLQSKLLEAERLAAVTETAIGVNHEINNPLCSILGNTQLLLMEEEKLGAKTIRKLRSIEKQIMRIQEISERLVRITKPVLKDYVGGKRMLDVELSEVDDGGGRTAGDQETIDKPT
jgi:PAS domain S-box-containing protein